MPRQNRGVENLLLGKIRKRGCSSSPSSTSSILQEGYRFKRAVVVRKRGGSSTPVPTWKLLGRSPSPASTLRAMNSRYAASPKYAPSQCGSRSGAAASQPVSARRLAATLWEMNELPSPKMAVDSEEKKLLRRKMRKDRIVPPTPRSGHSGSLPPHLSDPLHSPVSERMERSRLGSRQRRASSISRMLKLADHNAGAMDNVSNASFMEIETRSQVETPTGSATRTKTRLKDVSNALTTSKELLKIINRMWGQTERPSSSMPLVSALHAELERARLQVNRLIQEQRSDETETDILMKRFTEEKTAWQNREQEIVEAAIESVAGQLEVEKRLRRRFESLNKKLGKELTDTKTALMKAVKETESEKRARTVIEKVCEELAKDINQDVADANELKRETLKVQEEVEKEREMMQLVDTLREERVQMKRLDARHQLEEKNAAVVNLRSQVQAFLGAKGSKEKTRGFQSQIDEDEISEFLNNSHFGSYHHNSDGEVDDGAEYREEEENSEKSGFHSIKLNMDMKNYKYGHGAARFEFDEEENKPRKSTCSKGARKSASVQRSVSEGIDWLLQKGSDRMDKGKLRSTHKQEEAREYGDGINMDKASKDHVLSDSRLGQIRGYAIGSPARERPPMIPGTFSKSKLSETRVDGFNARKSRW